MDRSICLHLMSSNQENYIISIVDVSCGFIVSGGTDKNAVVFNKDTEQVVAILQGHTKKVTDVIYHPEEVRIEISVYNPHVGHCSTSIVTEP